MTPQSLETVLSLVKARLNRMDGDTSLDSYLTPRIESALQELNGMMRSDLADTTQDMLLLCDYAVWQYQCRDQSGAAPDWLRKRLRERFLKE